MSRTITFLRKEAHNLPEPKGHQTLRKIIRRISGKKNVVPYHGALSQESEEALEREYFH